ncbi:MAG: hypothetical protein M5U19_22910 [Microthrixaceae bacterium]|nr:hypothetical protein [Microthrixaceae bacterium]
MFPLPPGIEKVERELGVENLHDDVATSLVHQLNVAIKAKELYRRDTEYLVTDGEVKIVDEFTGRCSRAAAGPKASTRRWRPRRACGSRRRTRPSPR